MSSCITDLLGGLYFVAGLFVAGYGIGRHGNNKSDLLAIVFITCLWPLFVGIFVGGRNK